MRNKLGVLKIFSQFHDLNLGLGNGGWSGKEVILNVLRLTE